MTRFFIFEGVLFFLLIIGFAGLLPPEITGLICIIIPATMTYAVGYIIGLRGRPHLLIEFDKKKADD